MKDAKVTATFNSCNYSGTEMSDGERVALYLMAQILCVPSQSIIIIDESEVYLHKSIMNRLWDKLEEYRKDCLFIYITHDIQFATVHKIQRNCGFMNILEIMIGIMSLLMEVMMYLKNYY